MDFVGVVLSWVVIEVGLCDNKESPQAMPGGGWSSCENYGGNDSKPS